MVPIYLFKRWIGTILVKGGVYEEKKFSSYIYCYEKGGFL